MTHRNSEIKKSTGQSTHPQIYKKMKICLGRHQNFVITRKIITINTLILPPSSFLE